MCVCVCPGALQYLILPLVITRLESDTPTPRLLFPSRPPVFSSSSSYVYVLRTLIARNNYATITNGKLHPFITDFNYTKDSTTSASGEVRCSSSRYVFERAARPSSLRPTFDPSRNISGSDLLTLDPYLSPLSPLSFSLFFPSPLSLCLSYSLPPVLQHRRNPAFRSRATLGRRASHDNSTTTVNQRLRYLKKNTLAP